MLQRIRLMRAALATLLVTFALAGCGGGREDGVTGTDPGETYRWKLVTAWPPNLPVNHEVVENFARDVGLMSRGQMQIQVFAGGELIPALEVFDAVSNGTTVQMGHSAAYYWAGKVPAAQYMSAVPFGLTTRGMSAWLHGADGLQLWRDLYAEFDLVPFPMGNTGTQMGGWFNKRVDSVADLDGLKMRIPGLGGKALAKAGGNPILLAGGEVFTALERGNIDATEWVGPAARRALRTRPRREVLLLPGLARAEHAARADREQEGVRRAAGALAGDHRERGNRSRRDLPQPHGSGERTHVRGAARLRPRRDGGISA